MFSTLRPIVCESENGEEEAGLKRAQTCQLSSTFPAQREPCSHVMDDSVNKVFVQLCVYIYFFLHSGDATLNNTKRTYPAGEKKHAIS